MLDFVQVSKQLPEFAGSQGRMRGLVSQALSEAQKRSANAGNHWDATRKKIEEAQTSWLVAEWREPPFTTHSVPVRPAKFIVYSADGSQIVSDRHDAADLYLLNVGSIALRYGRGERAMLQSRANLHAIDDEMMEETLDGGTQFSQRRLAVRRLLLEAKALAEMSCLLREDPAIALLDGSLILWPIETEEPEFREKTVREFTASLEVARLSRTPIAGYISSPQSRDVLNSLRVFACPHEQAHCDRHCKHRNQKSHPEFFVPPCSGIERITDADLFRDLLPVGSRSAVFGSSSKILHSYGDHKVAFFYLNTGAETGRVEIPDWVAKDAELLSLTHALCMDQATKGGGYPLALAEAHELAVVRAPERDAFFRMLERQFTQQRIPLSGSRKSLSKRARKV